MQQRIVAVFVSLSILIAILDLVRRRRLREEYTVLWIFTGIGIVVLSLWYGLLEKITRLIGAGLTTSTLFFFALVFLVLVSLQFSVKISDLTMQVKELAQRLALLEVKDAPEKTESSSADQGRSS